MGPNLIGPVFVLENTVISASTTKEKENDNPTAVISAEAAVISASVSAESVSVTAAK